MDKRLPLLLGVLLVLTVTAAVAVSSRVWRAEIVGDDPFGDGTATSSVASEEYDFGDGTTTSSVASDEYDFGYGVVVPESGSPESEDVDFSYGVTATAAPKAPPPRPPPPTKPKPPTGPHIVVEGGWEPYTNPCGRPNNPHCGGTCPADLTCQQSVPGDPSKGCECGKPQARQCSRGGAPYCGGVCDETSQNGQPFVCGITFIQGANGNFKPYCGCKDPGQIDCARGDNGMCGGTKNCPDGFKQCGWDGTKCTCVKEGTK